MATEPNTTIKLYRGIPFDSNYRDTMYFASKAAQDSYFNGIYSVSFTSQYYQRINKNTFRIQASAESLTDMNYISITNGNHGNRTYYGFIVGLPTYINENTCEITYKIDVLQSFLFYYDSGNPIIQVLDSFVEREHSATDEIGDNLVEENVELGEYTNTYLGRPVRPEVTNQPLLEALDIVIALPYEYFPNGVVDDDKAVGGEVKRVNKKVFQRFAGGFYGGLYSPLNFMAYNTVVANEMNAMRQLFEDISETGIASSIVAVFYAPTAFWIAPPYSNTRNEPITHPFEFNNSVTTFDGYTPKNNKLFTYPYKMLYVDNSNGNSCIYPYEYFANGIKFDMTATYTVDSEVVIYPKDYKGVANNLQEKFTLTGYPLCPYIIDVYKNWIANNKYSLAMNLASAGLKVAGGISNLALSQRTYNTNAAPFDSAYISSDAPRLPGPSNPISQISHNYTPAIAKVSAAAMGFSAIMSVGNVLAQVKEKSIDPIQAKGSVAMSAMLATKNFDFFFYDKRVRREFAEIIDNYFTMFGYACHRVKVPNLFAGTNTRPVFYYLKTCNAKVKGFANTEILNEISSILDNGITFWFNPAKYGNYSSDNTPVT